MISVPRHNMAQRSPSGAFTGPFNPQVRAAAPKLSARSVLATGLPPSTRVVGTLHLPDKARSR